jgi:molybdopterin/thiamine biosynthesis adenylyltransferase|tara:strand:- start:1479 stop:2249 length:771 start_codon:yes stop_codon:yes gene_type:complete
MNDEQLLRYSRQIMVSEVDIAGQEKFLAARVLIIGLGGLGCPAAMYLAASGVGSLILADFDKVESSNLQRQIAHSENTVGKLKVESAATMLRGLNSDIKIVTINAALEGEALLREVHNSDVVLDCSDNFSTRMAVNKACVEARTPLVSGAAIRLEGQLAVFDSRSDDSPCYACLYDLCEDDNENLTCSESGILAPLVGVIGSMQALEALKLLADFDQPSTGKLSLLDAASLEWRQLNLQKDPSCKICNQSSDRPID